MAFDDENLIECPDIYNSEDERCKNCEYRCTCKYECLDNLIKELYDIYKKLYKYKP